VTAHFHLIFAGAVVIVYFAIAYHLWPQLTGRELTSKRLARVQLWLWFWGMLITTVPWHITGLMGEPRRMAMFDYADPFEAKMAFLNTLSVIGGLVMLSSVVLLLYVLVRSSVGATARVPPLTYALAVNPPAQVPALLNGFGLWNAILLALIVLSYGYPIGQFFFLRTHASPGYSLTEEPRR
jgi:cytochrome c oxidase subunit 1